jgi:hypothetical protein
MTKRIALTLFVLAAPTGARAATVQGTVYADEPVQSIELTRIATGEQRSTESDSTGAYAVNGLAPGLWSVRVISLLGEQEHIIYFASWTSVETVDFVLE